MRGYVYPTFQFKQAISTDLAPPFFSWKEKNPEKKQKQSSDSFKLQFLP